MIYTCKPARVAIYINTGKKTAAQIKKETGCTALINGGLYSMATFDPVCHLKVDGEVLSTDKYQYWGYAWTGDACPVLVSDYTKYDNYISCVCLVRDAQAEPLYYHPELRGSRPRTAIGTFADGRVWLYANTSKKTPEQLQTIALKAGVKDAVMLDGGGSTQCIFPEGAVSSSRRVHNFICVWEAGEETTGSETPMFKIALGAGHGINTPGKRCLKSIDPNETREWWLNDRICDYIERYLNIYTGYKLLRLDDSDDGEENVPLAERCQAANSFGADFYLSVHHNAGINGGTGGGIVAYTHPRSSAEAVKWRDALYDALIDHTGLKGNRSNPKATSDLYVLRKTTMPAVLLELGFMDSKTDVPVILSDEYAKKCAKAIVKVIAERGKLTAKTTTSASPAYVEPAKLYNRALAKTYTVTASALNLRKGAGTDRGVIKSLQKGEKVTCYGYYSQTDATMWLYVRDSTGAVGYCSKKYLK